MVDTSPFTIEEYLMSSGFMRKDEVAKAWQNKSEICLGF
jgi:hypothetical protein